MRALLLSMVLAILSFAAEGVVKEVLSENMILIEQNGVTKRVQLAGIALFSNVNAQNKTIEFAKREKLAKGAIDYLQEKLSPGERIKFYRLDNEGTGPTLIWAIVDGDQELNYLMVKNGYALLDRQNPYLWGLLEMRLKRAMMYAKEKRLGMWRNNYETMSALVEKHRHFFGGVNKNVSKEDILSFLTERAK